MLADLIDLHEAMAMVGGFFGAAWSAGKRGKTKFPGCIFDVAVGITAGAGVVERWVNPEATFFSLLIGLVIGISSGYILDAVAEIAPSLMKEAIEKYVKKILGIDKRPPE